MGCLQKSPFAVGMESMHIIRYLHALAQVIFTTLVLLSGKGSVTQPDQELLIVMPSMCVFSDTSHQQRFFQVIARPYKFIIYLLLCQTSCLLGTVHCKKKQRKTIQIIIELELLIQDLMVVLCPPRGPLRVILHTESWLRSLYSALGFAYLG